MIDKQKRNTLKLIGGSGLLAVSPAISLLGATSATADESSAQSQQADLEIVVIDTDSMPENTVLLTNRTACDVVVDDFLPGTIFYNGKWLSLNQVFAASLLNGRAVPAGHSVSARIDDVKALDHGACGDYLWAQQSVSALTPNTDLVALAATMQQRRAVVFAPATAALFA